MRTFYHHIAGRSVERLAALSDGIFAVAMTLLVLDLHVPVAALTTSEQALWTGLTRIAPSLLAYCLSFLTLGIFWVGQQTQLQQFERSDRHLTWIHLLFLFAVSLMPFSTGLLAGFITFRLALLAYWVNLLLLGVALFASWLYADRAGLIREDTTAEVRTATLRRIVVYQALYAAAIPLCLVSTYVSIVIIVLLQLNSAIAPRIFPLDRF